MANDSSLERTKRFVIFLDEQLSQRGWSDYKLAKQAQISPSVISRLRSGTLPKWEACEKIARALCMPTEMVFRAANLLPPSADKCEDLGWLMHMYEQLDDDDQEDIRVLLQAKIDRRRARATSEPEK